MKYLVMTEGSCEKAFLDVLVKKEMFSIHIDDLFYQEIFHARQFQQRLVDMINQLDINEKITVIRVGDKLSDELDIDEEIADRIFKVEKVCIKPEFEILHIIYRNEYNNYLKSKSKLKPCEFLCSIDSGYVKTYNYNYDYFDSLTRDEIEQMINNYVQLRSGTHNKREKTIADYLRKE